MEFQKLSKTAIIAIALAGMFLTVTTAGLLSTNQTVPLSGSISAINLGVYSDSGCTQPATTLAIGTINSGGTATQTVYVKNTGNVPETLTLTENNWNPANANTYLTLSWNKETTVLTAGQSTQATLTLTAASNTGSLTTFSCNVIITGTQ